MGQLKCRKPAESAGTQLDRQADQSEIYEITRAVSMQPV